MNNNSVQMRKFLDISSDSRAVHGLQYFRDE
jgi:hypothetical protein